MRIEELRKAVRNIPDFPKPGIVFKDITPIVGDARYFNIAINAIADRHIGRGIDAVVGIDARGFIFGAAVAYRLGAAFVPVRKKGKLPFHTEQQTYKLEYGEDTVEIHADAFEPGARVVLVDDLLATGGTAAATAELIRKLQGEIVELDFLIELAFLEGRSRISGYDIYSVIRYEEP